MTTRGSLLFAAMCVIWGVPYLLIKVAVDELSPSTLVLARTALAAALLLPIAVVRRELRVLIPSWAPLLAFAAIEIAIPWVLLGVAEQHVSSSLTGLLIAAVPLVGAVIALSTPDGERLGARNAVGLALGMVGVAAIVGLEMDGTGAGPLAAIGAVAVCYAVGPALLKRHLAGLPALGVIAASLGLTALAYVPIAAFSLPDETPSASVVWSVIALAVVCTAVAFVLFFALIAETGPVRATVITYVNPAVAAALGVLVLDEHLSLAMAVGFGLVLAGSVLATGRASGRPQRRERTREPACEPVEVTR
jgi:drug/metabolite transporter (DMT)-like permease